MSSDPAASNFFENLRKKFAGEEESEPLEQLEQEIEKLHDNKAINDTVYSMFTGILSFQGKMAREVMVPRTDAFMVDLMMTFKIILMIYYMNHILEFLCMIKIRIKLLVLSTLEPFCVKQENSVLTNLIIKKLCISRYLHQKLSS